MNKKPSSFTSLVKEEIITKPFSDQRLRALLAAFVKVNGRYLITNKATSLDIKTENAKLAKFLYLTIQKLFHAGTRFAYTRPMRFAKRVTYHVLIDTDADNVLEALGLSFENQMTMRQLLKNEDEIAGYLSGVFLSCGSVNDPESSNYHLELASIDEALLEEVLHLLLRLKNTVFGFKMTKRRHQSVLYLKRSDQIADFMILLGATDSTLEFENVRVARDFANSDNRWQICETANMKKTISSAQEQIENIEFLDKVIGIDNFPSEKMLALARLRLEDDSASMSELSNLLSKQLGYPVSKSNINHLFRAIKQLAIRLKGTQ
jgi:DNA-binding protein WhiA